MKKNNVFSNSIRFLDSYNRLDKALRDIYNIKPSLSYSDCIRRCAAVSSVIRKYEDDLIDYGRLRNAIVHRSTDIPIAEPHDDVVEQIEKIAKLVSTPPKAIETQCVKDVFTVSYDVKIKSVIEIMAQTSYSNIPVFHDGTMIGVANGQKIIDSFGAWLLEGKSAEDFLNNTTIEEIVTIPSQKKYYEVANVNVSIEEVMNMFFNNRKLLCIVLTKTGKMGETPVGIITATDYMDLNKVIENY